MNRSGLLFLFLLCGFWAGAQHIDCGHALKAPQGLVFMWQQDINFKVFNTTDAGLSSWTIQGPGGSLSGTGDDISITTDLAPGDYSISTTCGTHTAEGSFRVLGGCILFDAGNATVSSTPLKGQDAGSITVSVPVTVACVDGSPVVLDQEPISLTGIGGLGLRLVPDAAQVTLSVGTHTLQYHLEGTPVHSGPTRLLFFDNRGESHGVVINVQ